MANENEGRRRRARVPFGDRPTAAGAPPARDSRRQYLWMGLVFAGLVTAGVLIGVFDDGEEGPAIGSGTPAASADASPPGR